MSSSSNLRTRIGRVTAVTAVAALAAFGLTPGSAAPRPADAAGARVSALEVIGITPNLRLVSVTAGDTSRPRVIGTVSGMEPDTRIIGIDFRVQDGRLYAVGDLGGIYTLNLKTAAATRVSQLTVMPEGRHFGVDFNPAADRLRIISDTGQNLRHDVNPAGVTTMDGVLSYSPPTPATGVTMAAYTNNDLNTQTGTSLFDIDTSMNQVALQSPANSGSLAATGALGVDPGAGAGFDIYSALDADGATRSVVGLASLKPVGQPRALYRVNLLSGGVVEMGTQRMKLPLVDIAVPLDQD